MYVLYLPHTNGGAHESRKGLRRGRDLRKGRGTQEKGNVMMEKQNVQWEKGQQKEGRCDKGKEWGKGQ